MPDLGAGTDRAQKDAKAGNGGNIPKGNLAMVHPFAERVWHWLHAVFPERQIYLRSDGRVQFFTFSSSLQVTLAGLALIFLGWVAFASVNVIFKDNIIAAKDRRYQTMQSQYENRIADLQLSYDELNGALVAAGDRFKAIDTTGFPEQEALNRTLMVRDLENQVAAARFKNWQMPINQISGIHIEAPQLVSLLSFTTAKDYDDYVARLNQLLPQVVDHGMRRQLPHIQRQVGGRAVPGNPAEVLSID